MSWYKTQYDKLKKQYPETILLFRVGDFYEVFFDDATKMSKLIGLTLTTRDPKGPNPIPMAGFPYHQLEVYLRKMLQLGLRAAVCGQDGENSGMVKKIDREGNQDISRT